MTRGKPIRVLVTAAGGDLGQALIKSLRLEGDEYALFGSDMSATGIGTAFVERQFAVPPAREVDAYLTALEKLCVQEKIDVVIPASEPEIETLSSRAASGLPCGARVVCQPQDWIRQFGDKLNCMQALQGQVKLARFADGADAAAVQSLQQDTGYPLIVKSRQSSGSKSLCIAKSKEALENAVATIKLPIVQQYLDDTHGEYSVGVFACAQETRAIVFRRELGAVGCSWYAETMDSPAVRDYSLRIAQAARLQGSANIQVRHSNEGVRLLEINTRFSSLAAARALCGFKDVHWSVQLALGQPIALPQTFGALKFRRFFHELVDRGRGYEALPEWMPKLSGGAHEDDHK